MAYYTEDPNDHLITGQEVINEAPADRHSDAKERCKYIIPKEEALFMCFGMPFYSKLLADRNDYKLEGQQGKEGTIYYTKYREDTVFEAGKFVLYRDNIFEVIKQTEKDKGIAPPNPIYFKKAPKLKNQHHEYLWQRYLKKIIAWAVLHTSVMYRAIRDTNGGVVKQYEEGKSRPVTLKEIQAFKGEALNDLETQIKVMEEFIYRNKNLFPDYVGNRGAEDCEGGVPCNVRRRRRGFGLGKRKKNGFGNSLR